MQLSVIALDYTQHNQGFCAVYATMFKNLNFPLFQRIILSLTRNFILLVFHCKQNQNILCLRSLGSLCLPSSLHPAIPSPNTAHTGPVVFFWESEWQLNQGNGTVSLERKKIWLWAEVLNLDSFNVLFSISVTCRVKQYVHHVLQLVYALSRWTDLQSLPSWLWFRGIQWTTCGAT